MNVCAHLVLERLSKLVAVLMTLIDRRMTQVASRHFVNPRLGAECWNR
jgi:hypothetical protein